MTRSDLIDLAVREAEKEIGAYCSVECPICVAEATLIARREWPRLLSSQPITDANPGGGGKG
jgi:hypothetical protein